MEYYSKNNIEIVETFIDEAQSRTNIDRNDFQRMVAAAGQKEFDTLIIYGISRGSRAVADWFNFHKMIS